VAALWWTSGAHALNSLRLAWRGGREEKGKGGDLLLAVWPSPVMPWSLAPVKGEEEKGRGNGHLTMAWPAGILPTRFITGTGGFLTCGNFLDLGRGGGTGGKKREKKGQKLEEIEESLARLRFPRNEMQIPRKRGRKDRAFFEPRPNLIGSTPLQPAVWLFYRRKGGKEEEGEEKRGNIRAVV